MLPSSEHVRGASGRGRKLAAGQKVYVIPTNSDYAKLCRTSVTRLGKQSKDKLTLMSFSNWSPAKRTSTKPSAETFFVSRLADLSEDAARRTRSAPGAKYLLFAEGFPVEALAPRLARLDIRDEHRLHLAHEQSTDKIFEVIHRFLSGVSQVDGTKPIVDAWLEGHNLVALSPSFERLVVPLSKLSKFVGTEEDVISHFDIDEDGSFLYWPDADAHFGWDQLLHLMDPTAALEAKQRTAKFNKRYGSAIRSLREEQGLKQSDIVGLTDRHLRRVEQGQQTASKATLESLAQAHQMELAEYMNEIARRLK